MSVFIGGHFRAVSANAAVRDVVGSILRAGTSHHSSELSMNRGERLTEILNPVIELTEPRRRIFESPAHPMLFNPGLAVARFFYLLSGSNLLDQIEFYAPAARRFTDDGLTIPGSAYGHRIFGSQFGNQFEAVARIIEARPNTKRAVLPLLDPSDIARAVGSSDVPCATSIVFMPRDGVLHATVHMRANDALLLLPYNIFEFSLLADCMAARTRLKFGCYCHCAVSMHLRGALHTVAPAVVTEDVPSAAMASVTMFSDEVREALIGAEKVIRRSVVSSDLRTIADDFVHLVGGLETLWADLVAVLILEGARRRGFASAAQLLATGERLALSVEPCVLQRYMTYLAHAHFERS